jgi:hypothetical protein
MQARGELVGAIRPNASAVTRQLRRTIILECAGIPYPLRVGDVSLERRALGRDSDYKENAMKATTRCCSCSVPSLRSSQRKSA